MIKQPPAASPPVLDQKIPNLRRQFVVYWVNTAIKRGTQGNETKMAEQPVLIQSEDLVSYQIWRGQRGTQGTQSNKGLFGDMIQRDAFEFQSCLKFVNSTERGESILSALCKHLALRFNSSPFTSQVFQI